ncbi:glycosyltransferase [Canibacter zhoujuaniae]|uniref:glycosyltransferase n=1 Tax=Canibacter zhoujuaniae TaxID=2708343 RepID=UPI001FB92C3D|nr:glycosyltransferase [Canibacter zhoujuaniae]
MSDAKQTENTLKTAPFTLLMSVYAGDTAHDLKRAFESSVQEQTLAPAEAVIVQDGPVSPELAAMLETIAAAAPIRTKIIKLARNQGLGAALNNGLAACSYEYVARMDADDVSLPERFATQWARVQRDNLDLLGTGMYEFSSDHTTPGMRRVPPTGAAIRTHIRTHNPVNHPTMLYRKSAVEAVGGYDEMGSMEDYYLVIRMLANGSKVDNLAEPLLAYNVGDTTASGVYKRRGGIEPLITEVRIQWQLLRAGFIGPVRFIVNSAVKGTYRLLPAALKRKIFSRFVANGLPGERGTK